MNTIQLVQSDDWTRYKKEIVEVLNAIINSKFFRNSERMKSLIKYLVNENINSPNESLSPYQIAENVFRRGNDFDPSIDPILRVQMARTRVALERFNNQDIESTIQIQLPKGSYAIEVYLKKEGGLVKHKEQKCDEILKYEPLTVWFEPVAMANDPDGIKGLLLTNKLIQSVCNSVFFSIAGVKPWPMKSVKGVHFVMSTRIITATNEMDDQLYVLIQHPDNLKVLWSKYYSLSGENDYYAEVEKIIIKEFSGMWGVIMQLTHLYKVLPWLNKLYDFTMDEVAYYRPEAIDEIHVSFNYGKGIRDWNPVLRQVYIHFIVYSLSIGYEHEDLSPKEALCCLDEMREIYPNNVRLNILRAKIAQYTGDKIGLFKPDKLSVLPYDLLDMYATVFVKNQQWEHYLQLIKESVYESNNDISYFIVYKAFYYVLNDEKSKAIGVFYDNKLNKPFFLHNLLRVLVFTPDDDLDYQICLKRVEALQFEDNNDLTRLLESLFHEDDASVLSKMYLAKVKLYY